MDKETLQKRFQELNKEINDRVAEQNQIIGKLELLAELNKPKEEPKKK